MKMKTIRILVLVMCALFITNISSMAQSGNWKRNNTGGQPNPVMNNEVWGWQKEVICEIEKTASVRLGLQHSNGQVIIRPTDIGGIDRWNIGEEIIVVPETVEFEGVEYTVTTWKAGTRILGWNERVDFATAPDFEIYIPSTLQAIEDSVFLRIPSPHVGGIGLRAHFRFFFECEQNFAYSIAYQNNFSEGWENWENWTEWGQIENWLDLEKIDEIKNRWGENWFVRPPFQYFNRYRLFVNIWNRNCSHFCGNDYENCPNGCVPKEIEVCDECGLEDCECENNSVNVREVFSKIDFWVDGNVVRLNKEVSQISVFGVNGQLVAVGINANEIRIPNNGVHIVKVITREGQRAVQRVIVM